MSLRRFSLAVLFILLSLALISCEKEEEVKTSPAVVKAPLPQITAERLQLWFRIAPQIGSYIRKFALEGEAVNDKRDLLMLAHSSARTQMAYSEIFDSNSMSTSEFWNIINEIERVKKYLLLKHEESTQNVRIDELIKAGEEEMESMRSKAASNIAEEKKSRINASIREMELKMVELRELKGNLTPASVHIDETVMALAKENINEYEKVVAAMWKSDGETRIKKIMEEKKQ